MERQVKGAGVIGLTGGIGSGKSLVAALLANYAGMYFIDMDKIARRLLAPGGRGWQAITDRFGPEFLQQDGSIDRKRLRDKIFQQKKTRIHLNNLLHPLIREELWTDINQWKMMNGPGRCLVEVPLLYEARWEDDFSRIIVVYADHYTCLKRVIKRDGITFKDAELALASQIPITEKALRANHVIDNRGPWPCTLLEVMRLGRILLKNS